MSKGTCWSITINNPTDEDYQSIEALKHVKIVKEWKSQLEQGENGTPHIQGMLKTESIRFAQVKKLFPRAHIEKAKNALALAQYVEKEDTKVASLEGYKALQPTDIYKHITTAYDSLESLTECYKQTRKKQLDIWESFGGKGKIPEDTFALKLLDRHVSELIKKGAIVEFVCSNPSFRTAFKTYFLAIMYRTYNAKKVESPASQEPQDESSSGEEDVNEPPG